MANFMYNEAKRALLQGELDLSSDDIRAALVMSNTSCDTEDDVNFVSGFATLDECDDTTYTRLSLSNESVSENAANNRAELDADNITFANTGDASRDVAGVLIYKHVTNDADSVPIVFIEEVVSLDGNNVVIEWNADGIVQLG